MRGNGNLTKKLKCPSINIAGILTFVSNHFEEQGEEVLIRPF